MGVNDSVMKSILAFTHKYRFSISLFSLVFRVRMSVFWYAGSPLPFFDQWVFSIYNIFLYPHLSGHAIPWYMFIHNEHRPLMAVFAETDQLISCLVGVFLLYIRANVPIIVFSTDL